MRPLAWSALRPKSSRHKPSRAGLAVRSRRFVLDLKRFNLRTYGLPFSGGVTTRILFGAFPTGMVATSFLLFTSIAETVFD